MELGPYTRRSSTKIQEHRHVRRSALRGAVIDPIWIDVDTPVAVTDAEGGRADELAYLPMPMPLSSEKLGTMKLCVPVTFSVTHRDHVSDRPWPWLQRTTCWLPWGTTNKSRSISGACIVVFFFRDLYCRGYITMAAQPNTAQYNLLLFEQTYPR